MSPAGEISLVPLQDVDGAPWQAFLDLYGHCFPATEREPEARIAARVVAGRYRLVLARTRPGTRRPATVALGFSLVDRVPRLGYAVLTYLAVAPEWRGRGIGRALVAEAVADFRHRSRERLLLVEAVGEAAGLYRGGGFSALEMDYRVPEFAGSGVQPMTLLAVPARSGQGAVPGETLKGVVRHMFVDGYGVAPDDARLEAQVKRIPEQCAFQARC